MAWTVLCKDDPIVNRIREDYHATPLRIPSTDVEPLLLIRSDRRQAKRLGRLEDALTDSTPLTVDVRTSLVADRFRDSTRSVELSLGLDILGDFLRAFGLSTIGLAGTLSSAQKLSFAFQDVTRVYVDLLPLGRQLVKRKIDLSNSVLEDFMPKDDDGAFDKGGFGFYIVDSVIKSSNLQVKLEKSSGLTFKADVPAVQQIVGSVHAGVTVGSSDGSDLVFRGQTPLTFAFSVVQFFCRRDGTISVSPDGVEIPSFNLDQGDRPALRRTLLSASPALVDFEPSAST